jgi:uncharacterized protein
MHEVVASRCGEIAALCEKHGVRRLEVFGSAARGDFAPASSDVDFLVEIRPAGWHGMFSASMGPLLGLEELFGRRVDLVMPASVTNRYLQAAYDQDRETVYAFVGTEAD